MVSRLGIGFCMVIESNSWVWFSPLFYALIFKNSFSATIGVREIFSRGGGGGKPFAHKKSRRMPKLLRKSRKERKAVL